MRQILLKRLLVSLILVEMLLFYTVVTSHTITLNEVEKHSTNTPWPTCASVPYNMRIRCNPTQDPFSTTTTWHSRTPHPEK